MTDTDRATTKNKLEGTILIVFLALTILLAIVGKDTSEFDSAQSKKIDEKPTPPADFAKLLGVSDVDSPNETLLSWFALDKGYMTELVKASEKAVSELGSSSVVDISRYEFDDELLNSIQTSNSLRWLRIGRRATAADIEWVCELRNLRGLSLRRADLRKADLSKLSKLVELRWLDLWSAKLPKERDKQLPQLKKLEVLVIDSEEVTDQTLPDSGQFPELEVLSIKYANISDEGVRILAKTCPKLRYLMMFKCTKITKASLKHLAKFEKLQYLHIGDTQFEASLYDREFNGVPELQRLLPKCYIALGD